MGIELTPGGCYGGDRFRLWFVLGHTVAAAQLISVVGQRNRCAVLRCPDILTTLVGAGSLRTSKNGSRGDCPCLFPALFFPMT